MTSAVSTGTPGSSGGSGVRSASASPTWPGEPSLLWSTDVALSGSPVATGSISPTADSLVVLVVMSAGSAISNVSGAGLTWTQQINQLLVAGQFFNVWTGTAESPSAGTITLTGGTTKRGHIVEVPDGEIVQSKLSTSSGDPFSVTLDDAFGDADNHIALVVAGQYQDELNMDGDFTALRDDVYHPSYNATTISGWAQGEQLTATLDVAFGTPGSHAAYLMEIGPR